MTTTSPAGLDHAGPIHPTGRRAALAGVLAVAAALGVGQLVGAIVSPSSSPYLAVADAVVRISPQWLVEFATSTFGTADKLVLLVGMAVVLGLVSVGIGLAGRRDETRAVYGIVALGAVAVVAVVTAPTFGPLDLLAPAAAILTGTSVYRLLHGLGTAAGGPSDPQRRRFLRASVLTGAGAVAAAGIGRLLGGSPGGGSAGSRAAVTQALRAARIARSAPPIPAGAAFVAEGTPPFVTPNADFYRIDTALRVPNLSAEDWTLRIHGMVDREIELTFADVLARPLVERVVTLVCVSNEVGDEYISTAVFTGVDLRALLLEAGVQPGADQVLSTSTVGWTAGTPPDDRLEPDRGAL
ncbi:MAG: molybdopterin-dependent oxidoreductase, partial [Pseudonocardia sp.]